VTCIAETGVVAVEQSADADKAVAFAPSTPSRRHANQFRLGR